MAGFSTAILGTVALRSHMKNTDASLCRSMLPALSLSHRCPANATYSGMRIVHRGKRSGPRPLSDSRIRRIKDGLAALAAIC